MWKEKKSFSRVLRVLSFSLGFLLLLLLILFFVFLFVSSRKIGDVDEEEEVYRYYRLNFEKNESSVGFLSLDRKLRNDEYISYKTGEGDHFLISNFEAVEYVCTGQCYCEENRRGTTLPVTKGLFYLVAAASSFLAIQSARSHFEDNNCKDSFVDDSACPLHAIKAEVESCEPVKEVEVESSEGTSTSSSWNKVFHCKGRCLPHDIAKNAKAMQARFGQTIARGVRRFIQKDVKNFGCRKMELNEDVDVISGEIKEELVKKMGMEKYQMEVAKVLFAKDHLEKFCWDGSLVDHKNIRDKTMEPVAYCVGSNTYLEGMFLDKAIPVDKYNPSVKCIAK